MGIDSVPSLGISQQQFAQNLSVNGYVNSFTEMRLSGALVEKPVFSVFELEDGRLVAVTDIFCDESKKRFPDLQEVGRNGKWVTGVYTYQTVQYNIQNIFAAQMFAEQYCHGLAEPFTPRQIGAVVEVGSYDSLLRLIVPS